MRIGILGTFPDPNDPKVSKAGYRGITELSKLLSENNEVTIYPVYKKRLSFELPFCKVVPIYSLNLIVRWIKLTRRMVKDRRKLDILIVHNPTISVLPVVPLKLFFSIPVVVDYADKQTTPTYAPLKILRFLGFISEKLFLLTTQNWFTDSGYLEREIRKVKKGANIMLHRGVLLEQPSLEGEPRSPPLEIRADRINIAYSGALAYHHGVDILIDAFSSLPDDNRHLYITGFGPAKRELEEEIARSKLSNATVAFLDNEVLYDFYRRMDIFVIPYRNTKAMKVIGFPSKIIGYTWAGKAIIATRVNELQDAFQHEETAILVEPDSAEALRGAMLDLVDNERKRRTLGLNARKYFEENFSEKVARRRFDEFLRNVLDRHKKSAVARDAKS